jgi:hypothetical protein
MAKLIVEKLEEPAQEQELFIHCFYLFRFYMLLIFKIKDPFYQSMGLYCVIGPYFVCVHVCV